MRKLKLDRRNFGELMPFIILVLLVVIFTVGTGGRIFTVSNLLTIFNQSVITIIAGLGMIFVVAIGGTDITHGSLVAVAGAFAAMAATNVSSALAFPVAILVGILSGALLGVVNTRFKVPSFMASLSLLIALRAYATLLLNTQVVFSTDWIASLDSFGPKLVVLAVLAAVCGYMLKYTRFGAYCKAIGENENAMRFAGINTANIKLMTFIVSGILAGIASVFTLARLGGASNTMGSGFEMRVMMAMFIGGVPVSGGMGTKMYKLFLGAPMIVLLENGLVLCGASGGTTQLIQGLVLLLVVYIMVTADKRAKAQ